MIAVVEVRYDSEMTGETLYWSEVATVECGRWYHWRDLLGYGLGGSSGTVSWSYLREHKAYPIFDGKLSGTHLYLIARAMRDLYGPKHVRVQWRTV